MNPDYRDLFSALNDARAEYLLVGAHAVAFYAEPRYTRDIDVLVDPAQPERVWQALRAFGAPLQDLQLADLRDPRTIYQIGVAPNRIDILTSIPGVTFREAWSRRVHSTYGDVAITIIAYDDLVAAKRAAGRDKDLIDLRLLEKHRPV